MCACVHVCTCIHTCVLCTYVHARSCSCSHSFVCHLRLCLGLSSFSLCRSIRYCCCLFYLPYSSTSSTTRIAAAIYLCSCWLFVVRLFLPYVRFTHSRTQAQAHPDSQAHTDTHTQSCTRTCTQRHVCIRHVRVHVDVLLLSPLGPLPQRCHIARTNFNFNSQTSFTCMKCEYESPSEISLCTWPCQARPGQTWPGIQAYVYMYVVHVNVFVCTRHLLLRLQIINDN